MIEQVLSEILADRAPIGAEADHLAHLARLLGLKTWRSSGVGHLKVGATASRWWVAIGIDEPTLLLSGEGTDQAWGFSAYGMPKDRAQLRNCELRHQSGQMVTASGPEAEDGGPLKLHPAQPQPPVGGSWAIWPRPLEFHGSRLIGPGAGGRLLTAAVLSALQSGRGQLGAVFVRLSRLSAASLTEVLATPEVTRVIWLSSVGGEDSDLGSGAYQLRAPALPGDPSLEQQMDSLPARFVQGEALPPFALDIRRAGRAEFGLGIAVTHLGGARETADLKDGEKVSQRLAEIMAMG